MITLNWKCISERGVWNFPFTLHEKELTDLEMTKIMAKLLFWTLWTILLSSLHVFMYVVCVCVWVDLCMCVRGESIKSNWLQNVPGALNNFISHTLNYIFTPQAPEASPGHNEISQYHHLDSTQGDDDDDDLWYSLSIVNRSSNNECRIHLLRLLRCWAVCSVLLWESGWFSWQLFTWKSKLEK